MDGFTPLSKLESFTSLGCAILIIVTTTEVAGLSSWSEGSSNFRQGQFIDTALGTEAITLAQGDIFDWKKVADSIPGKNEKTVMAYDSINNQALLFTDNDEVWIFDFNTNRWTDPNPINGPSRTYTSAMAYDTSHRVMVLLLGDEKNNIQQTWIYNIKTNTWTDMKPKNAPWAMSDNCMVYDSRNDIMILFGGYDHKTGNHNETWTYKIKNNSWTRMNPTDAPSFWNCPAIGFDPQTGNVVLFGGQKGENNSWSISNETWLYNLSRNVWWKTSPVGSPSPRSHGALAYCDALKSMVLIGGVEQYDGPYTNETWIYDVETDSWHPQHAKNSPVIESDYALFYRNDIKQMTLFQGNNLRDIWTYHTTNASWQKHTITYEAPPAMFTFSAVYDDNINKTILFGGNEIFKTKTFNDTWVYDLITGAWTKRNPTAAPQARFRQTMTYDKQSGLSVLYGGRANEFSSQYFNDTWVYDAILDKWTLEQPPVSPVGRENPAMVYNDATGSAILFGGVNLTSSFNDTWTYNVILDTWTEMHPVNSPPARWGHNMIYDWSIGEVILFGGHNGDGCFNDTWTYNYSRNEWTNISSIVRPNARYYSSMVYNNYTKEAVLFSGWDNSDRYLRDYWVFNSTTNSWRSSETGLQPIGEYAHAMVYDTHKNALILLGGNEVWAFIQDQFHLSGAYTSPPYDTGGRAFYGNISWNATRPAGTSVAFQLRTAITNDELAQKPFIGPDETTSSFYLDSGQSISSINNASRWIQYRAYLTTDNIFKTPMLHGVRFVYNLEHHLSIISPVAGDNWTDERKITWAAYDDDDDSLLFDIYLENDTIKTLLAGNLSNNSRELYWDTTVVPNGSYRINIIARDDNPSIPLIVNATSGDFIIYHPPPPPPNHPPHVSLMSPANNSFLPNNTVRFRWNGTDPDGDLLTYTIHCSDSPFIQGNVLRNVTINSYIDITDLDDDQTYYWTIDATDGKASNTDIPTEIWCFTVRMPPANIPVRITSKPPSYAQVGKEYAYNITSVDEDGDIPIFSIISGLSNMTMNSSTGRLRWIPEASDVGNHSITIQVSDGHGSIDRQTFLITVIGIPVPPPEKPQCDITSPSNNSKVSGRVIILGTAFNGTLPLTTVQVRVDGGKWQAAVGLRNWTILIDMGKSNNGLHVIEARSFDGSHYSNTSSIQLDVRNPGPKVTIEVLNWYVPLIILIIAICVCMLITTQRKWLL